MSVDIDRIAAAGMRSQEDPPAGVNHPRPVPPRGYPEAQHETEEEAMSNRIPPGPWKQAAREFRDAGRAFLWHFLVPLDRFLGWMSHNLRDWRDRRCPPGSKHLNNEGLLPAPTLPRAPSPLTTCAGAIQGASRRILEPERPAINPRLLASGIAWGNTEHKRRWR